MAQTHATREARLVDFALAPRRYQTRLALSARSTRARQAFQRALDGTDGRGLHSTTRRRNALRRWMRVLDHRDLCTKHDGR